ncbi:hypothetical protein G7Y79_00017g043610 [Physcia stellaris]|nr:hypothetical protein G7Y79_00017g043610 [Physcia stellaris]
MADPSQTAFLLALLTAGGGLTGYIRTGSVPSVAAGMTVGALVYPPLLSPLPLPSSLLPSPSPPPHLPSPFPYYPLPSPFPIHTHPHLTPHTTKLTKHKTVRTRRLPAPKATTLRRRSRAAGQRRPGGEQCAARD